MHERLGPEDPPPAPPYIGQMMDQIRMRRWLDRGVGATVGTSLTFAAGVAHGPVKIGGDFAANIAGATIGGAISVALAIAMFSYQRRVSARDAKVAAERAWDDAIDQSLRHIRAIRDAVQAGKDITLNSCDKISAAILSSSELAKRALNDTNLTDFNLRLAMEEAAQLGHTVSQTLPASLRATPITEANASFLGADTICDPVLRRLEELMAEYKQLRNLPTV